MILWIHLMHDHLLDQLIQESYERPILVFVHNRSEAASNEHMDKIERQGKTLPRNLKTYYLDGIKYPHLVSHLYQRLNLQDAKPTSVVLSLGKLKNEFIPETLIQADHFAFAPAAA